MSQALVIAGYAIREAIRRRVFTVVLGLTAAFVALYGLAVWQVFRRLNDIHPPGGIEPRPFAGATIFGLSMFATMFLGVVLGVFLTMGVVRGDAERGLLQPLLVRPLSRSQLLLGRLLAAVAVCTVYVACVYTALMLVTGLIGDWWPDRIALPGIELAVGVSIIAAVSLLGSVFLSATANGIAVFMVFGSGLVAGLLGSIGQALGSGTLKTAAHAVLVGAAIRGALPGWPARDHREHGVRRIHPPARPVRRSERRRPVARPVGRRLRDRRSCPRANRLRPPRPLSGSGCGRQRFSKTAAKATVRK